MSLAGLKESGSDWRAYQEEAAAFFRSLGMRARTDVRVQGVRTHHDVDVLVEADIAGLAVRWIVECKNWQRRVSKLHLLALREIVSDIGADRGIVLSETGFQSGVQEAANFTNVQATSLAELENTSRSAMEVYRLRELFDRTTAARERYWALSKDRRIATGLRGDTGNPNLTYTGTFVAEASERILSLAFREAYPIEVDALESLKLNIDRPRSLDQPGDVIELLEPLIIDLESKLDTAEVGGVDT